MDKSTNALNWFELPVSDIGRATKFYEEIFNIELQQMDMQETKMALFPFDAMSGKLSGALVEGEWYTPSKDGVIIYFNGNPDLSVPLSKVIKAGGTIVLDKMQITEDYGYMAMFIDSEGNRVALHSND